MAKAFRLLAWLLAPVALCGGGGWFAYHQTDFSKFAGALELEQAAARNEGVPIDYEAVALPPVANRENALTSVRLAIQLHQEAARLLTKQERELTALPIPQEKADQAAALKVIASFEPAFLAVREAGKLPHLDFHRNYALGSNLMFPEYADIKDLVRLLAARAQLLSLRGQSKEALNDLQDGARLTRHLDDEPVLIAALVHIHCESILLDALRFVAGQNRGNALILQRAASIIGDLGSLPNPQRCLRFEIASSVHSVEEMRIAASMPPDPRYTDGVIDEPLLHVASVVQANEAASIAYWRKVYPLLPTQPEEYPEALRKIAAINDHQSRTDLSYYFKAITMPVFNRAMQQIQHCEGNRRLTLLATSLLGQNPFPATLPVTPATTDPMSNRPFSYARTVNGFKLSDSGITANQPTDDVMFTYPPVIASRRSWGSPRMMP